MSRLRYVSEESLGAGEIAGAEVLAKLLEVLFKLLVGNVLGGGEEVGEIVGNA